METNDPLQNARAELLNAATPLTSILDKYRLANRLLASVMGIYLAIAVLLTTAQISIDINDEKTRLNEEVEHLSSLFLPLVSRSLWELDRDSLKINVTALLRNGSVLGVKVTDATRARTEMQAGHIETGNDSDCYMSAPMIDAKRACEDVLMDVIKYEYPITYRDSAGSQDVGYLLIYSSNDVVLKRSATSILLTLFNALVKTVVLWVIFVYFARRQVTEPLEKLTRAVLDFYADDNREYSASLNDLASQKRNDEIGVLVFCFALLRRSVMQKNEDIRQYQRHLEKRLRETQDYLFTSKDKD